MHLAHVPPSYDSIVDIIRDVLFHDNRVDLSVVRDLARSHGVHASPSVDHTVVQSDLVRHLFMGHCFSTAGPHCVTIADHHDADPRPFLVALVDTVLNRDVGSNQLTAICKCIGLSPTQLSGMTTVADRLSFLRAFRDGFTLP